MTLEFKRSMGVPGLEVLDTIEGEKIEGVTVLKLGLACVGRCSRDLLRCFVYHPGGLMRSPASLFEMLIIL